MQTVNQGLLRPTALSRRAAVPATVTDTAIALFAILPLLLTAHLPLADLPNHLARQYVLRDYASSTFLQDYYQIHWDLVPNLALEIFVFLARQVMSIDLAVRAFCIVTVLLLFAGTRLINREISGNHGRIYRVVPLLCYGGPFQYGFLSYCFGIGLALVFFGLYLRLRTQPVARLALWLFPAGIALMLCHLMAYAVLALAAGATELAEAARTRSWKSVVGNTWRPVACLTPVFLLFVWLSPTADPTVVDNGVHFSTLHEKARSLASITMFSSPTLELTLLGLAIAGLIAALLSGAVRLHRTAPWVIGVLTLAWLALPNIAVGAAFIDYRLPWVIAFFVLAGCVPGPRFDALSVPFAGWFGGLAMARIAMIAAFWLAWEPTLAALDAALGRLPEGARLITVEGLPPGGGVFRHPTLTTTHAYAVARRQVFDPGMFANMTGQTLYFQPHYRDLWREDFLGESPPELDHLPSDYNYVLVLVPETARISPGLSLTCQEKGPHFELLKAVAADKAAPPGQRLHRCPG